MDNSEDTVKKNRRQGELTAVALEKCNLQSEKSLRHKTIQCGLKAFIRSTHRDVLLPLFQKTAKRIGIIRHFVALMANEIIISGKMDMDVSKNSSVKTFYGRIYSGLVAAIKKKPSRSKDAFTTEAEEFLKGYSTPDLSEAIENAQYDLFQQELVTMETRLKSHIQLLPCRLQHFLEMWMLHSCKTSKIKKCNEYRQIIEKAARIASKSITCEQSEFDSLVYKATTPMKSFISSAEIEGFTAKIQEYRSHLQENDMLDTVNYTSKDGTKKTTTKINKLLYGTMTPLGVMVIMPLMLEISQQLQYWKSELCQDGDQYTDNEADSDCDQEDTEDGNEDEVLQMSWKKRDRPMPFSAAPMFKIKPSMVYYGATEIKTFCGYVKKTYLQMKRSKKNGRKRQKLDPEEPDPTNDICAKVTDSSLVVNEFIEKVFDLSHIKGCRRESQQIIGFRTNGVIASVTWGLSGSSVIKELYEKGINIPPPLQQQNVNTMTRGLLKLDGNRSDILPIEGEENSIEIVGVDPGKIKPLHAGITVMDSSMNWNPNSRENIDEWAISKSEYLHQTGRDHSNKIETLRRKKNVQYGRALEELRECTKRTSCPSLFTEYKTCLFKHSSVLIDELCYIDRTKRQWVSKRQRMAAFARWADKLFNRTTIRRAVTKKTAILPTCPVYQTEEEKRERRRVFREKLRKKRIVFFGDGSFSSCSRGSCPIAKKDIIKTLACRGVTVYTDEFRTSKCCPCGSSDLIDDEYHYKQGCRAAGIFDPGCFVSFAPPGQRHASGVIPHFRRNPCGILIGPEGTYRQ